MYLMTFEISGIQRHVLGDILTYQSYLLNANLKTAVYVRPEEIQYIYVRYERE